MKIILSSLLVFFNRTLVSVLLLAFAIPASIIAFYGDTEKLDKQNFTATELHFASLPQVPDRQYISPVLNQDDTFTLPTNFTASSTKALYDITSVVSGDLDFCASLRVSADGYLGSISAEAPYFATEPLSGGTDWQVKLSYNTLATSTNFAHGAKCDVTLKVEGWQENMTKATAGYRDAYSVTVPVVAQMVVLNEVLAMPDPGEDEFIELYNLSPYPVDVAGFNITEKTSDGDTVNHIIRNVSLGSYDMVAYDGSGTTIVPAHGFLALRYSGGTSYLDSSGDTITLLDTESIMLDTYTFGTAITGKSDARMPDGTGPWIDPIPTPNEPNTLTEGETDEVISVITPLPLLEAEIIIIDTGIASGTFPITPPIEENIPEEDEETEENEEVPVEEAGEEETNQDLVEVEVKPVELEVKPVIEIDDKVVTEENFEEEVVKDEIKEEAEEAEEEIEEEETPTITEETAI